MSGKDKLISVEHLKWNVGGIKCGTLSVDYLNWILDHEEPAVDAEPVKHGEWMPISSNKKWIDVSKCSVCGKQYSLYPLDYNYCPNCGARMDEE